VRRLERIAELGVLGRVARVVHNTRSPLPGVEGRPELAELFRGELERPLAVLDAEVGDAPFVAGDRPSIADCTLFAAFEFALLGRVPIDPRHANLHRWHAAFRERPGAQIG
jgi:glutathione S-transferase